MIIVLEYAVDSKMGGKKSEDKRDALYYKLVDMCEAKRQLPLPLLLLIIIIIPIAIAE